MASCSHSKNKMDLTECRCSFVIEWAIMPLVLVQVRDWGPGQPADLGSLQVESFAPGDDPADDAKPFADVLARRLEWLQVCAQPTLSEQVFLYFH